MAYARFKIMVEKKLNKIDKSKKENIWDEEIRNELCKGLKIKGEIKYKYQESIPKEVLQLKRASMKLERLINELKKGRKSKKQIEEEKKQE